MSISLSRGRVAFLNTNCTFQSEACCAICFCAAKKCHLRSTTVAQPQTSCPCHCDFSFRQRLGLQESERLSSLRVIRELVTAPSSTASVPLGSEHTCDAHAASSKLRARCTEAVGVQKVPVELALFAPRGFHALANAFVWEGALWLPVNGFARNPSRNMRGCLNVQRACIGVRPRQLSEHTPHRTSLMLFSSSRSSKRMTAPLWSFKHISVGMECPIFEYRCGAAT